MVKSLPLPLPRPAILVILLCLAAVSTTSAKEFSLPMLAGMDDSEIRARLEPLLPVSVQQMDRFGDTSAVVFKSRIYATTSRTTHLVRDVVWWVREGEAEDITNFVRDFDPGEKIENVRAFVIRAGEVQPDAVLGAPIERIVQERIRITQKDDNRQANLVIGFDTARPGDLIGVSVMTSEKRPLDWEPWLLASTRPVAGAELRLMCDRNRAFAVFGSRFPSGMMDQKVLDQKDGQILDLRITAGAIPPMRDDPYAPPRHLQSPQLTVTWRATRVNIDGRRTWVYNESWNQIAATMALLEKEFLRKDDEAVAMARHLAGDLPEAGAVAALHEFVTDELMSVNTYLYYEDNDIPDVNRILEARSGSVYEKAYLLLAMLRGLGLEAELVWAHDPDDGGFFHNYPSLGQVSEPMIRVVAGGAAVWLDMRCGNCRPGEIRSRMRGVEAATYLRDADDRNDDLWDFVIQDAYGRQVGLYHYYMENIKKKNWQAMIRMPGRQGRYDGWCEESLTWGGAGTAELKVESIGRTALASRVEGNDDAREPAEAWARQQHPEFSAVTMRDFAPQTGDTLRVEFDLEGDAPSPPMGDAWIIPPQLIYGDCCMEVWPQDRITDFHVGLTTVRKWEVRLPLPEGWETAEVPSNRIVQAGPLSYQAQYAVKDGHVVVSRILVEKAGTIRDDAQVERIGQQTAAIIELETSPIVVRRLEKGS